MRIFAIAQRHQLSAAFDKILGRFLLCELPKPGADCSIIDGSSVEGLCSKLDFCVVAKHGCVCAQLSEERRVVVRINNDSDASMVLGSSSDHCRSAYINCLDALLKGGV